MSVWDMLPLINRVERLMTEGISALINHHTEVVGFDAPVLVASLIDDEHAFDRVQEQIIEGLFDLMINECLTSEELEEVTRTGVVTNGGAQMDATCPRCFDGRIEGVLCPLCKGGGVVTICTYCKGTVPCKCAPEHDPSINRLIRSDAAWDANNHVFGSI